MIRCKTKQPGAKVDFNSCLLLVFIRERETTRERKKWSFTDSYCEKCSLQFDKRSIFKMHLSIVHKGNLTNIGDLINNPTLCHLLKNSFK